MAKIDFKAINETQRYTQWVVLRGIPGVLGSEREDVVAEARSFFEKLAEEGRVVVRGIYDVTGIRDNASLMIWWHAEHFSELQDALTRLRRDTVLGQSVDVEWIGNGLHRPAEFNKSHVPAFLIGTPPGDWLTVYPFVRAYDWYVMDPQKRRQILVEHGKIGRDYPEVRANTVESFALGDYEWMLAFEAPEMHNIVDLMHAMRYTEARLHVRVEIPFYSGRRLDDVAEAIAVLP